MSLLAKSLKAIGFSTVGLLFDTYGHQFNGFLKNEVFKAKEQLIWSFERPKKGNSYTISIREQHLWYDSRMTLKE